MLATRPLRFILLGAFVIFVITLLSGYGPGGSLSWLSTSSVLSHDVARVSLREHMRLAEKIWSKTVEQRHNLLGEWRYPENMPLYVHSQLHIRTITPTDEIQIPGRFPKEISRIAIFHLGLCPRLMELPIRDGENWPNGRWRKVGVWDVEI
jgi:hypothetical protein